jgi:hypothetical protein
MRRGGRLWAAGSKTSTSLERPRLPAAYCPPPGPSTLLAIGDSSAGNRWLTRLAPSLTVVIGVA